MAADPHTPDPGAARRKEAQMGASFVYYFTVEGGPIVAYGLVDARTYKTVDVVLTREDG